jgi:hypothetical protein
LRIVTSLADIGFAYGCRSQCEAVHTSAGCTCELAGQREALRHIYASASLLSRPSFPGNELRSELCLATRASYTRMGRVIPPGTDGKS